MSDVLKQHGAIFSRALELEHVFEVGEPRHRPCVLVAGNTSVERRGVCRVLTEAFVVRTAKSAEQAFFLLGEHSFHAVVTDYKMIGRSGLWLLEKTRRVQPSTRRVLTSAVLPPRIETNLESGLVQHFLRKPFRAFHLHRALESESTSNRHPTLKLRRVAAAVGS